jgi:dTDP-4-amino-4,6-dideoxygalactose transaminase
MNIPLLDLKAQYLFLEEEIMEAVRGVLNSGRYILGPNVYAFEQEMAEFCGTKYAVGVGNGTDALVLSLDACGIGPGDEVITTSYSFFATAEAISRVGADPVFVDIDRNTYNMDVTQIEDKISERTRAILPVHLFGQMALMDQIMEIAHKRSLIVIEDACQAIGASYQGRRAGSWGDAGCFSFFPSKNLGGCGDGGMITTNDAILADRLRMLRAHGSRKKYYNEAIGYNSRLDELQAAILRVKLRYLETWNEARRKKAERYNSLLAGLDLKLPYTIPKAVPVYHLYIVAHPARNEIINALSRLGIGTGIYYPVPLHKLDVYKGLVQSPLPVVEQASQETFAIPLFPEMTDSQQDYIAEQLAGILQDLEK